MTLPGRDFKSRRNIIRNATYAPQASTEAGAAFGDRSIYVERLIENARHIEVQLLGDGRDVVHFHDRECSLQRRRQKVWEEAPSAAIDDTLRRRLCGAAVRLGRSVNYRGAGTVEFLLDDETGGFFFIEMNTRIQVEHPVTELICGTDLVVAMIRVSAGERLWKTQDEVTRSGHAIEVRLNAEDPSNDFMPFPGIVSGLRIPDGDGVRFDHMLYDGYAIPPFYDSLLGKLIVWAPDRGKAITRLRMALECLEISGLPTTAPLYSALVDSADVQANAIHTGWLEAWLAQNRGKLAQEREVAA